MIYVCKKKKDFEQNFTQTSTVWNITFKIKKDDFYTLNSCLSFSFEVVSFIAHIYVEGVHF